MSIIKSDGKCYHFRTGEELKPAESDNFIGCRKSSPVIVEQLRALKKTDRIMVSCCWRYIFLEECELSLFSIQWKKGTDVTIKIAGFEFTFLSKKICQL